MRTAEDGEESESSFAGSVSGGDEDDLENRQLKVLLIFFVIDFFGAAICD